MTVAEIVALPDRDRAVELEQHVLGGLLMNNTAWERVADVITADDFYIACHRAIFQQITDLIEDDRPADVITVATALDATGNLERVGGQSYLGALAANIPGAANIRHYAEMVANQARARSVAALGNEMADRASLPGIDVGAVLRDVEERIADLRPVGRDVGHLDLVALSAKAPKPPHFPIAEWAPSGYAIGFFGHGGTGKSTIALMLAVCMAAGRSFAGIPVERKRVLYYSCEDREDVLHWRLSRICLQLDIPLQSLDGWLDIKDMVGKDCVLWERDPRTGKTTTAAYRHLAARIRAYRSEVLIIDGVSDTFAGNENARTEVKRYLNAMLALVPLTGFVLVLGHVAKPTAENGSTREGYSGSTQWNNGVRARWYLYPEVEREDDDRRPVPTGRLVMELQKSNNGPIDRTIGWRWDNDAHLFLPESAPMLIDLKHRDREEQDGLLRAFKSCEAAGQPVPAALQGPRTAYLVLSQSPEFPASLKGTGRQKTKRFREHLEALRRIRHIDEDSIQRKGRHSTAVLVLTSEGSAVLANSA